MDKKELLEIEENIKQYDENYETKTIEPGNIIDVFIETNELSIMSGQVLYVCKEGEGKADVPAGIPGFITYKVYDEYYKGCLKDQTIKMGNANVTINEIYENVYEYTNRFDKDIEVGIGSVVDVNHNGHKKLYYIIEPTDERKVQKGLDVIDTNSPLAINLLSKKMGDRVSYDIALNNNDVEINRVYKSINDFNKRKGINLVKEGTVVEVKIDKMPFSFRLTSNIDEPELAGFENVGMDTPLGRELAGKTEGDYFVFNVRGNELAGYINKVHDSLEDYQEFYKEVNKEKTLS